MRRMLGLAVAGCLTAGMVGCASNEMETRREIASAALSNYPGGVAKQSDQFQLAAVDNRGSGELDILNLTDNAVPPAKLWVNGRYVSTLAGIQARGSVKVKYGDLLESGRGMLDLAKDPKPGVAKAELQIGNELYAIQGPTIK
jgi:hypothetical protein